VASHRPVKLFVRVRQCDIIDAAYAGCVRPRWVANPSLWQAQHRQHQARPITRLILFYLVARLCPPGLDAPNGLYFFTLRWSDRTDPKRNLNLYTLRPTLNI
jgi:hypothetical protein